MDEKQFYLDEISRLKAEDPIGNAETIRMLEDELSELEHPGALTARREKNRAIIQSAEQKKSAKQPKSSQQNGDLTQELDRLRREEPNPEAIRMLEEALAESDDTEAQRNKRQRETALTATGRAANSALNVAQQLQMLSVSGKPYDPFSDWMLGGEYGLSKAGNIGVDADGKVYARPGVSDLDKELVQLKWNYEHNPELREDIAAEAARLRREHPGEYTVGADKPLSDYLLVDVPNEAYFLLTEPELMESASTPGAGDQSTPYLGAIGTENLERMNPVPDRKFVSPARHSSPLGSVLTLPGGLVKIIKAGEEGLNQSDVPALGSPDMRTPASIQLQAYQDQLRSQKQIQLDEQIAPFLAQGDIVGALTLYDSRSELTAEDKVHIRQLLPEIKNNEQYRDLYRSLVYKVDANAWQSWDQFWYAVGDYAVQGIEQLGRGAKNMFRDLVASGVMDQSYNISGAIAEQTGLWEEGTMQHKAEAAADYIESLDEIMRDEELAAREQRLRTARKYAGLSEAEQTAARWIGGSVPTAALAATGYLDPLIPMSIIGSTSYGSGVSEALADGASPGDARTYGLFRATKDILAEKLINGIAPFGRTAVDIDKISTKLVSSPTGRQVIGRILGAAGEGSEEVISTLFDPLLKRLTYDPDAPMPTEAELWDAFGAGTTASLLIGIPVDITDTAIGRVRAVDLVTEELTNLTGVSPDAAQRVAQRLVDNRRMEQALEELYQNPDNLSVTEMQQKASQTFDTIVQQDQSGHYDEDSGILYLPDIQIFRSLGAAAWRDTVKLPNGKYSKLSEGSVVTKVVPFAGRGTKKALRVAPFLAKRYGGSSEDWSHLRGEGFVDVKGTSKRGELHWFEDKNRTRYSMKVKRWFK